MMLDAMQNQICEVLEQISDERFQKIFSNLYGYQILDREFLKHLMDELEISGGNFDIWEASYNTRAW